jgi:hypothetical protein
MIGTTCTENVKPANLLVERQQMDSNDGRKASQPSAPIERLCACLNASIDTHSLNSLYFLDLDSRIVPTAKPQ